VARLAKLERNETLTDRVVHAIRSAIINQSLARGSVISIPKLAQELGVSATPVREAVMHLRQAGLVTVERGGVIVAPASKTGMREAYELREALEGMTGRLAAMRRTPAEAEDIVQLAKETAEPAQQGRQAEFRAANTLFHDTISEAARNARLAQYLVSARDLAWVLHEHRPFDETFLGHMADTHTEIAQAIVDMDADRSEALLRAHVRDVCNYALNSETTLRGIANDQPSKGTEERVATTASGPATAARPRRARKSR
jgi:DNA-binding GntR family transcriptional regulator